MNAKLKNIKKEPELRPEYIKKLKKIKKEKSLKFKSIDELRKSIESK